MSLLDGKDRVVYVLRCPSSGEIRYVGLTRNPNARRIAHRSAKKTNPLAVDKWTSAWAEANQPVEFEIVATMSGEFAAVARAIEETVISGLRKAGCDLINADMEMVRRRVKPPRKSVGKIIAFVVETPELTP